MPKYIKLGKPIRIGSSAIALQHNPGLRKEYYSETVEVIIGIGNDHHATLIMGADDHAALLRGEKISISSKSDIR